MHCHYSVRLFFEDGVIYVVFLRIQSTLLQLLINKLVLSQDDLMKAPNFKATSQDTQHAILVYIS